MQRKDLDSDWDIISKLFPTCSRCVCCSVCCHLSSPSQQIPHPRKVATSPSTPPNWFAVCQVQWGLRGTQGPMDPQGPWDPWGRRGRMGQMGRMGKREKREMEGMQEGLGTQGNLVSKAVKVLSARPDPGG
ncbi:unnamed protein product [Pleuronectes platessa]|uniref:Uncharacterized protein n=1 Tax=Pleuronectes platessa TaxID=8262 RepID=A0A9N7ZEB8_PLEPL|nr:unnamed protein product [Pleuronectes platessa]